MGDGDDKPEQPSSDNDGGGSSDDGSALLPPQADLVEKGRKPGDGDGVEVREND